MQNTIVVKYGGSAIDGEKTAHTDDFAQDIVSLTASGARVVVVHGGGPQINTHLQRLGIEPEWQDGLRVTTEEVLHAARMVLTGSVQRDLVNRIQAAGGRAVGISGEDDACVRVQKRRHIVDDEPVDLGFVGDVTAINTALIDVLLDAGHIPVVSSVACDEEGIVHNVNADSMAGALAGAMHAEQFILLTDVPGLFKNWPHHPELIHEITCDELLTMLPQLEGGIVPKMESCCRALKDGAKVAHVVDGRSKHALREAISSNTAIGTKVIHTS